MATTNFKARLTYHRITKLDFASSSMRTFIVLMATDANFCIPKGKQDIYFRRNPQKKKDVLYSKKLELNLELVKQRLKASPFPMTPQHEANDLEYINVFGKGNRLQVFSGITLTEKSAKTAKNKKKPLKGPSKFAFPEISAQEVK